MKKKLLCVLFAIMGIITNVKAEDSSIIIDTNLSLDNSLGSNVTAYPNSVTYPSHYEVNLRVRALVNTGEYGRFSFSCERRVKGTITWGMFTPNTPFPFVGPLSTPTSTYNQRAIVLQVEGTEYEYRVKVTFNSLNNGSKVVYTPIRTAKVLGVPTPCFTMYNVLSTQNEPSFYGPMPVMTICQNAVTINGSCSKFESGYHIGISEFDLTEWSFIPDFYYNNWVSGSGEAPSFISLNALAAQNGKYFQPGKLYAVGLSIGPVWKSAPVQFFRVVSCKTSGTSDGQGIISFLDIENDTIDALKLYPNPVKDVLTITVDKEEKIISYEIFDNYGSRVKKEKLTVASNEQNVNLTELKKGFYIINIETDKGSYKEKIIKE